MCLGALLVVAANLRTVAGAALSNEPPGDDLALGRAIDDGHCAFAGFHASTLCAGS